MKNFNPGQIKILTNFLTTIAAGWFTAGVITTVFIKPIDNEAVYNVLIGILAAFLSLSAAFYFDRKGK